MITKRRENESDYEYGLRLIKEKSEGSSQDIDWQDIIDFANVDTTRESLRKQVQGVYGGYNVYKYMKAKIQDKTSNVLSEEILDDLELQRLELEKEKIKVRDQKREYRKMQREIGRAEYYREYIEESARQIAELKPLDWDSYDKKLATISDTEAVAMLGDFHYGMNVDNFLNTYNEEVFIKRFQKYISKIIQYGKMNNVSKLHILDLNDNISGNIHTTTRIKNNEDVITQIQFVSEVFAEGFVELSKHFDKVDYHSVLDNHSRVTARKDESIDKESFSRFVPWYLEVRMRDVTNFTVMKNPLDDEIAHIEVCGYLCYAVHGHHDNHNSVVSKLSLMTKRIPDYVFMGHYHRSMEDNHNGVYVIGNPSGIGTDDYAKGRRLNGAAEQKMVVFNKEEGRFATYNVKLD